MASSDRSRQTGMQSAEIMRYASSIFLRVAFFYQLDGAALPRYRNIRTHQALVAFLVDCLHAEHQLVDGHVAKEELGHIADENLALPKGRRGRARHHGVAQQVR